MDASADAINAIERLTTRRLEPLARPDGGKSVLVPEGYTLQTIPPLEPPIPRIRQSLVFSDQRSFVDYVEAFKHEGKTRIFALPGHASPDKRSAFTAVIDYHQNSSADHCVHRAAYIPAYSEEWVRWTKAGTFTQVEFAEFIEENRRDIVEPAAALLLDIVTKFKASRKQEYDSLVYQANGDITVAYSEKTENAGKPGITVPPMLQLGIPVFFKGERYSVPVFLRYKLSEGKLLFTVKVDRADYVEQAAFDTMVEKIADSTKVPVLIGCMT